MASPTNVLSNTYYTVTTGIGTPSSVAMDHLYPYPVPLQLYGVKGKKIIRMFTFNVICME